MSAEDLLLLNRAESKHLERISRFGSFKVNLNKLCDQAVAANPCILDFSDTLRWSGLDDRSSDSGGSMSLRLVSTAIVQISNFDALGSNSVRTSMKCMEL